MDKLKEFIQWVADVINSVPLDSWSSPKDTSTALIAIIGALSACPLIIAISHVIEKRSKRSKKCKKKHEEKHKDKENLNDEQLP